MRPLGDVMVFIDHPNEVDLMLDATLEAINEVTGGPSNA